MKKHKIERRERKEKKGRREERAKVFLFSIWEERACRLLELSGASLKKRSSFWFVFSFRLSCSPSSSASHLIVLETAEIF